MKNLIALFILCISTTIAPAQIDISTDQWQKDLRFLQNTVHTEYPFLFKKTTKEDFDKKVDMLRSDIPNMKEHEIIIGLAEIVASFGYGHTSLPLYSWRPGQTFDFHQLPYHLMAFEDGIFIQGTHKDYENALGAKVLKIADTSIEKALDMVQPVFPSENDMFYKAYGMYYLGVPEILDVQGVTDGLLDEVTLILEKDGKTFEQSFSTMETEQFPGQYGFIKEEGQWLDARDNSEDPYYLRHLDKIYYYEYLPEEKTVYIRHSQIQDDPEEPIPAFYDRVFQFVDEEDVEKLVIDVRLNGGGNNYKNKPIVTGIIETEKINQPGKLFVLINGRTFSACQNLVNELSNYTNAVFVGEPTGENINFYGDNREITLPNSKIPLRLSYAWWQDKPQWENDDWLAPHIAVEMSFEEYRTNQDPVLETALAFDDESFILDPMQHMTDLFMAGEKEKLGETAAKIVNDPKYRFFDFEGEFNTAGYNVLNSGDAKTAIEIFGFVVRLFPDSANAWDSFAEAHWKAGEIEKAKEYYNKAISIDPDGNVGDNARKMLVEIEKGE
ncbi:MAG: hypothetical protein KJP00_04270 [Bacteroidia bacterium]|nr:hypothetical protein [Bacteroidia bacterium]